MVAYVAYVVILFQYYTLDLLEYISVNWLDPERSKMQLPVLIHGIVFEGAGIAHKIRRKTD